ncbi:two-partner secretion domain-containing protein [Pseudomonas sp. Z13]|uniref:two-partner secretion domain-containing protein n=1 Tax=Pseudomonas sp. Z13 TaxID=2983409 RepID=UPI002E802686|nr:filamentous hemagglutinin N-terminal domain-containing protein [Pseudomonas sp. Z13]
MDIRMPGASLNPRDYFLGMPKRGLALLLANVMFWQPLWAQADGIAVSGPGTTLGQAGNGVPIVNIAAPNGSGLSHNQFSDYNVGQQGVILNNTTNRTQSTQLGGIILGNPNLKGNAANIILNEVTGGSPSQLRGYTEVAGQSAKVIVANPYGITCNGCGFINTPNVTLTTGKPVLDNGRLDHYQVDGGAISIDGQGLNASNVGSFEIITRAAQINAQINANQLSVVAGRNDVDAQSLKATVRADNGSAKPQLAIDSSALGGMYAEAIRLVGTEAGVGVKLDGTLAASGGDIQLDANGHLSLAQTAATGAINVKAVSADLQGPVYGGSTLAINTQGDLNSHQTLAARDSITLTSGGQLTNNGIIEAGVNTDNTRNSTGDVQVTTQTLSNTGNSIIASRNLSVTATQALNNQGGTLSAKQTATLNAGTLDNQNQGRVLSTGSLNLTANQVLNAQGGLITSSGPLTATVGDLNNRGGEVSSLDAATITVATLDNVAGLVTAGSALKFSASNAINNQGGKLTSQGTLALNAGAVDNSAGGRIASNQALTASVSSLDQQGGQLFSKTSLSLDLNNGQLNNAQGLINAPLLALKNLNGVNNQNGEISSDQAFTLAAKQLDNSSGKLISNQALTVRIDQALVNIKGVMSAAAMQVHGAHLDNSGGLISSRGDLGVTVDDVLQNQQGVLVADGDARISANRLDNSNGQLSSKRDLTANVTTTTNQNGLLVAEGALELDGTTLDNRQNGLVGGNQGAVLTVANTDNRGGEISSKAGVTVSGNRLDNSDSGRVIAGQVLNLTVDQVLNQNKGLISTQANLNVTGTRLLNNSGTLRSQKESVLTLTGELENANGLISSEGVLSMSAASLANRLGSLSSAGLLTVSTIGAVDNQGGQLVTDGGLVLRSASLDNSQKGTLSSAATLSITTGNFDNSQGTVSTRDTLDITAGQLTNQNGGRLTSSKALTASVSGLDQQGGTLFSETSVSLDLNQGLLNNHGGLINAPLLMLKNLKGVNNQGGEISSAQAFILTADSLDNSNGKLLSNQALTLRVAQALTNLKGMIAAQSVDGHAASLDNSGGTLTSRGDLLFNADGQISNHNDGLINAANTLTLNSTGINNQNGSLLGSAIGLDFGNTTGDLNNAGGLITTAGLLTITHLRDLNNQGGEISSGQSLNLTGRSLGNSQGKLISNNLLTLNGTTLINQGGLMSGWQGVSVTGTDLDNRNSGTVSSRYGNVDVHLSNALQNSGSGALVSQKDLTVTAASLDNSDKGIVSSGGGQTFTVSSDINNSQGGLIDSGAALDINAQTVNNKAGAINAQQALTLTGSYLDNTQGALISNGAITLDLIDVLTNTNGKLASGADLLLKRASQINNQGGQLASQGLLTLLTGGLDNRHGGTVAANDTLTLTTSGAVQNSDDGLIASQNADVRFTSNSLDNAKGSIQSQTALGIDVAGAADNQSGKLIAQAGDVTFKADSLDNRGGTLASLKGNLEARTVGLLRNGYDLNNNRQGGTVQGQNLKLTTGSVDNYGGRVAAQTGDAAVSTGNFDNRNGGLYAKGVVSVTGADFDNSGTNDGQIAGQQITLNLSGALNNQLGIIESDSTLNITAASLDNQSGQVRALGKTGKTVFQIGGLFDNRNGTLETANQDVDFQVGSFQNVGGTLLHVGTGTLGITPANLTNAGGSIITRGGLTIDQDTWTNSSVIQAGRLTVKVNTLTQEASGQLLASDSFTGTGNNWTTAGLIASDSTFDLTLAGKLDSTGRASSLGNFNLSAAQLDLSKTASLAGGGVTGVNLSGTLNNNGRLTSSGDLNLNTGTLNNYGTLGSGQKLTATTGALLNDHGLVFSGGDMALHVDTLTNTSADIYSLGDIEVLGQNGTTQASRIDNLSGRIESTADMSLKSAVVTNKMDGVSTSPAHLTISSIGVRCSNCASIADGGTLANSHLVWLQTYEAPAQTSSQTVAASLTAGKNLTVVGDTFTNANSSVTAGGTLNMTVTDFNNTASLVGGYTSLKYITMRPSIGQWGDILNYNSIYDPSYNHNIRFWNAAEQESMVGLKYPTYTGQTIASYYYYFGAKGGSGTRIPDSQYGMGAFSPVPSVVANATPFSEKIIASANSSYVPSIVQAGGAVTINAKNKITNGVEKSFGTITKGSGLNADTQASGTGTATIVTLNRQLRPDLAQQQINLLSLPGFSLPTGQNGLFRLSGQASSTPANSGPLSWTLGGNAVSALNRVATASGTSPSAVAGQTAVAPTTAGQAAAVVSSGTPLAGVTLNRVQGVPDNSAQSRPQKYLIETNPALTDLKQFMSSDYLLSNLGYNPDTSWKRLGDGLYEQRLVEQAVVARTGQRFIDGQTSNQDLFKYLMNNAIQSKQQLNLAVGVSLTAEQVAALTHDIVWMETAEVNGEKVLVPVVYLAQANNRLAPNGALIAGSDLNLIAGKDLENVGSLRATNNLSAQAGQNLVNSGLIEAGNRLDLLAGGTLVNKAGGIIAGRDVSLKTVSGDVINERTVTDYQANHGTDTLHRGYVDSAARIEAANQLTIGAGRDFNSTGGVIKSGTDTTIQAGRDINLMSAQQTDSLTGGKKLSQQDITQHGTTIEAGRDFTATAGRDINSVASKIDARRDISMVATGDMALVSAADEQHSYSKSRSTKKQEDHVSQVATTVNAGGDVSLGAGKDMTLVASKVAAGNEAYLVAGGKLGLLAAQDSDYSLLDLKKGGNWGGKKTQRDEVTQVTNVGSEIKTGGDLTLQSGGDQTYQVAKLESGKNITLDSGGAITFEAVKDLHQESHEKSKNSFVWNSAEGHGNTDETLRQSQLIAQGSLAIKAVDGLKIDIKQIDQNTVTQTIDAMVKADPQLAWLKEAEKRGDVDWRKVKEVHDSFKYSNSSLGGGAALVIAIIVTYFTWGLGAQLAGVASTTTTGMAANSVYTAVAVKGATSTINNKGNLGAIAKDMTSGESLKGYAIAGISAPLSKLFGVTGALTTSDLGRQLAVNSALRTVANGGSFTKNVGQAAIDLTSSLVSGMIYERVGRALAGSDLSTKVAVHAIVGGLIAEAAGGDFAAGAIAAGANKALIQTFGAEMFPGDAHERLLAMTSQLIGMTVAAGVGGSSKDQEVAGWVAQQGTVYNYLEQSDVKAFAAGMGSCKNDEECQRNKWKNERYDEESLYKTQYALGLTSSLLAKDKLPEIIASLDDLMAIQCVTTVCEGYKTLLVSRAVAAATHLTQQIADWGPSMDRLGLLQGGGATSSSLEPRPKLPGAIEPAGLTQLEKAIKYLQGQKSPTGTPVWSSSEGIYSGKLTGDYPREATDFSSGLGAKATGGAAEKVDDVVASSSKPEWLQRLDAGNEFNKVQSKNYPNNEVYIQRPDGNGYYRVDSYNPIKGEIVSRKFTQLSEVSEATAKSYISEAITKYPSGATIAKVPSSGSLGGQKLQGTVILEVPPQNGVIPKAILDSANKAGVLIRDTNGKVY